MTLSSGFRTLYSSCRVSERVDGVELFQFHPSGAESHVRARKKQTDVIGKTDDVPGHTAAATSYLEYAYTWLCKSSII